jgi:predicted amidohydrolase
MFKLALIQMQVRGGCKTENLDRAEALVRAAGESHARMVLLPEAMPLGWTHPSSFNEAEPIPGGATCERLRALARDLKIYLCSGLIEQASQAIFNSAVLIDPEGELLLHHRKLNELQIAHDFYAQGDRLQVAHTPLGKIGLMICADAFAPRQIISRSLGYMGADVILSPSAWAVPADHDNAREPYGQLWIDHYAPVARDFQLWIAGASNVGWIEGGPWHGRKCIGCSLVIDPAGQVAARGPYGVDAETILYVDIEPQPRPARGEGWRTFWGYKDASSPPAE